MLKSDGTHINQEHAKSYINVLETVCWLNFSIIKHSFTIYFSSLPG